MSQPPVAVHKHAGRLSGQVALVTGAASGLGVAIATRLAEAGAKVLLTDIDPSGQDLADRLSEHGHITEFCVHDVSSETSWDDAIRTCQDRLGPIDILVNNAGIGFPSGSVEAQSLSDWRRIMSVNADGVFLGLNKVIPHMRAAARAGSIINISSILGIVGNPNTAAYVASKGAVRLLTKSAALHCGKQGTGIRVNSVHPGYIMTALLQETLARSGDPEGALAQFVRKTPIGHCGTPDDIAFGVLYLASDEARFVTGTELVIDGGYTAQ